MPSITPILPKVSIHEVEAQTCSTPQNLSFKTLDEARTHVAREMFIDKKQAQDYLQSITENPEKHIDAQSLKLLKTAISEETAKLPERLVVVSNRMIDPKKPAAGGLAVALGETMKEANGLWFGWSGNKKEAPIREGVHMQPYGKTTLAGIDLNKHQQENYYSGYFNSVLWPTMHDSPELAEFKPEYFETYMQVNKLFAAKLAPMLKEDDVLWIHDFHLAPLAKELREQGCKQQIGFFNHTPFPSPELFEKIPHQRALTEAMLAFDLIGMQVPKDINNFCKHIETQGFGKMVDGGHIDATDRKVKVQDFPIGIDLLSFRSLKPGPDSEWILGKVEKEAQKSRTLLIGAERLDYTKGVPVRLEAFGSLLSNRPDLHGKVTLVQIAAPSRGDIQAYQALIEKTDRLVKEINNQFGNEDWEPVMYINESVNRNALPKLYSMSRVGIVSSVADGMNLVAKEYIAAQNPENPGVPIISKGAGAAAQLHQALLFPSNNRAALAAAYEQALEMPIEERKSRYVPLMRNVEQEDLPHWRNSYLKTLYSMRDSATPEQ